MKTLLLGLFLAAPAFAADVAPPAPLAEALPSAPSPVQALAVPGLPAALGPALLATPLPLQAAVAASAKAPAVRGGLAQAVSAIAKSPQAAPASLADLYDGIGAKAALATSSGWSEPVRAPTPAQAAKLLVMKRLSDAFLLKKGLWFPHKMAAVSPANPSGLRGILVGDLKTSVAKYGGGVIVLDARHVDSIAPARLADAMLHELVHHLNPHAGGDEMISHMLEAEFSLFVKDWLRAAGLGYDLKPRPLWNGPSWRWMDFWFGGSQAALRDSYAAGTLLRRIARDYGAPSHRSYPIGFPEGSAGARRNVERLRGYLAGVEAKLARPDLDAGTRAQLERSRRAHLRSLEAYERLVIPTLELYERTSGWKPEATGTGRPK